MDDAIGIDKVDQVRVKRCLRKLQQRSRVDKQKVPQLVADAFTFAEGLLVGSGYSGTSYVVDAEAVERNRTLKVRLKDARNEAETLKTQLSDF